MRHRERTLEELEEEERRLLAQEDLTKNDGFYGKFINLYQEMYDVVMKNARQTKDRDDKDFLIQYANDIKERIIHWLIKYGTCMKMNHEKSDILRKWL
ncbi:hypothetical protein [Tepidibacillus fermentans]|uniref:Uncharacterized protein n=1 Tax=Tepidibacillus fermentans TaxID=1281767 RepID=A0A4R3KL06_9BACI|nr:hypothetical protein [Tepidibacillus fermentans]TCS84494.1 hypothetical protein EDD72_101158 [Tepidibacillus fermentans]